MCAFTKLSNCETLFCKSNFSRTPWYWNSIFSFLCKTEASCISGSVDLLFLFSSPELLHTFGFFLTRALAQIWICPIFWCSSQELCFFLFCFAHQNFGTLLDLSYFFVFLTRTVAHCISSKVLHCSSSTTVQLLM